jgi:hypothetical protein
VTRRYPSVGVAGGMAALWHAQATPCVSPSEDTSTPSITGRVGTSRAWVGIRPARTWPFPPHVHPALPEACTPGHPWPYSIPVCAACLAPTTGARPTRRRAAGCAAGDARGCSQGAATRQHHDPERLCRRRGAHLTALRLGSGATPTPGARLPRGRPPSVIMIATRSAQGSRRF